MMKFYKLFLSVVLLCMVNIPLAWADMPVTTDSRIKVFVYNENEVYHLTIHYGYQSNIEFAEGEEIETISMGESYSWKITPIGRRLFIKPLQVDVRTNMTVITNRHTYQFDIIAKMPDGTLDDSLVYVARFYYPDKNIDRAQSVGEARVPLAMPMPSYPAMPTPVMPKPTMMDSPAYKNQ